MRVIKIFFLISLILILSNGFHVSLGHNSELIEMKTHENYHGISAHNVVQSSSKEFTMHYDQHLHPNNNHLIYENNWVAQSFIPTFGNMKTIDLKLKKIGNPPNNITVSLYDALHLQPLCSVTKASQDIPDSFTWITFHLDNASVYENGPLWTKFLWGNYEGYDHLFITYDENETIDQQWTHCSGFLQILNGEDTYRAQSFKPASNILSKISLYIGKYGEPGELIVTIMDSLYGKELGKVSIPPDQIPTGQGWIDIHFNNIPVVQNELYYIVCRTLTTKKWDTYAWGYGYNDSGQVPYTRGEPWESYYSGTYYLVCTTQSGDTSNCYFWDIQGENNTYDKGASIVTTDAGHSWHEEEYTDMCFYVQGSMGGNALDQYQHQGDHFGGWINGSMQRAQSFKPIHTTLTKVRLILFANIDPTAELTVSIRKELNESDLTSVTLSASEFCSIYNADTFWYEFDFPDINVTPDDVYYIVCTAPESQQPYDWMNMALNYYQNGDAYVSYDSGNQWEIDTFFIGMDQCFETYYTFEDTQNPFIHITKPEKSVYINDNKIFSLRLTSIIIGKIHIEINATDYESGVNKVELSIDDTLQYNCTSEPYRWTWDERTPFRWRHRITVIAFDNAGNSASDEITVWKFF